MLSIARVRGCESPKTPRVAGFLDDVSVTAFYHQVWAADVLASRRFWLSSCRTNSPRCSPVVGRQLTSIIVGAAFPLLCSITRSDVLIFIAFARSLPVAMPLTFRVMSFALRS